MTKPIEEIISEELDKICKRAIEESNKRAMELASNRVLLVLDGGGTRGAMEAQILDDIMLVLSIMVECPGELADTFSEPNIKWNEDLLKKLREKLKDRKKLEQDKTDPKKLIHPTEVLDTIVGTSTGGLIAMGLVGGNKGEQMTVEEVKDLYHEISDDIFGNCNKTIKGKLGLHSYRIKGLQNEIAKKFNKDENEPLTLGDIRKKSNGCNAGVVATKMKEVEKKSEKKSSRWNDLVKLFSCKPKKKFIVEPKRKNRFCLFSTNNKDQSNIKVSEILAATANAPVYFEEPVPVAGIKRQKPVTASFCEETTEDTEEFVTEYFVDGGVGANCPISAALKENPTYGTIISIAPPKESELKIQGWGVDKWAQYLMGEVLDGDELYEDEKERDKGKMYVRIRPLSEKCASYKMDSQDTVTMVKDVIRESESDPRYFLQVLHAGILLLKSYKIRERLSGEITKEQEIITQAVLNGILDQGGIAQSETDGGSSFQKKNKAQIMKLDKDMVEDAEKNIAAVVQHFK